MSLRTRELADAAATEALGASLAGGGALLIALSGPLGAGKTTLVRGLLRALGHAGAVRSPTYTLVERYELPQGGTVQHFDLYRLADPIELEEMGIRDYFAEPALRLVEWPERAGLVLGTPDVCVTLELWGDARRARLESLTVAGRAALERLEGGCGESRDMV